MKPSKNECFTGFKLSLENSKNFIDDAKLLLKTGSYGHSLGLSMLAMEECGKAILLLGVSNGITELDKELTNFIFKNHIAKIVTALYNLARALTATLNLHFGTGIRPVATADRHW